MYKLLFITLLAFFNSFASAHDQISADPTQESRAKNLFTLIRCTECKGQSIKDSNAEIAFILRHNVRKQIEAGKTDQEILDFLVDRYGEEITLKPKFNFRNSILWLLPALIIILIGYIAFRKTKFKL